MAVRRRPLTAEARVRSRPVHVWSVMGKVKVGRVSAPRTSVFCCQYHCTSAPCSSSTRCPSLGTGGWSLGTFEKAATGSQLVNYRIHKRPPPVSIPSQLDPVHVPTSHLLKIHLNIILPSTPGSSRWSLSLRFPHQNPVYAYPFSRVCYMPSPSHYSRFNHPDIIG
jgi:hypothetical protein